jgi:hypothetical protein
VPQEGKKKRSIPSEGRVQAEEEPSVLVHNEALESLKKNPMTMAASGHVSRGIIM